MRILVVWLALLCAAGCSRHAAAPAGPEVRVLTDRTESHLAPIFAAFERATGIPVLAVFLDAGLVARLESRPVEADVVVTKDVELLELARTKGLLRRHGSRAIAAAVPELFRDTFGTYFSDSYRGRVVFRSKERVGPDEISTYRDLAEPRWKGRVCIRSGYHDYNVSLFAQMHAAWGPEPTRRFLEGLAGNLARAPSGSDRDQVRAIYEGECDVAVANSYYRGIMLSIPEQRPWALATELVFPDQADGGAFVLCSGAALTTADRNVPAARALLEYLVGPDVQRWIADRTFAYATATAPPQPPKPDAGACAEPPPVPEPPFVVHHMPPHAMAERRNAIVRLLDEIRFDRPR